MCVKHAHMDACQERQIRGEKCGKGKHYEAKSIRIAQCPFMIVYMFRSFRHNIACIVLCKATGLGYLNMSRIRWQFWNLEQDFALEPSGIF